MRRPHWRRFLPRRGKRNTLANQPTDVIEQAVAGGIGQLEVVIEQQKRLLASADKANKKIILQNLLVLQAPRAARAQAQMDTHKHGYHDREKRLYELIEFNDTFVDAVLELDHDEVVGFTSRIQKRMNNFCLRLKEPMLSDEQFEAIVHGLSREIAVYRGAKREGFIVRMTSRRDDAFGIDMVIQDRTTNKHLNVDCKTPSAFRYRLEELVKEDRISEEELLKADEQDYCQTRQHRKGGPEILVTILCIRPDRLGEIIDFSFHDTTALKMLITEIFHV